MLRRRIAVCLFALLVSLISPAVRAQASGAALTGELPQVLERAGDSEFIPVSIVLKDQLTGTALTTRAKAITDRDERRRVIVSALQSHAARTQARLRAQLESLATRGLARRVRPLWIGNVIGVDLTKTEILRLAQLSEIDHINWNPKRDVFLGAKENSCTVPPPATNTAAFGALHPEQFAPAAFGNDEIECGVQQMQAPRVWNELGNTGNGAVIAVIDTGACWTHSDIINQVWVNPGEDLNHNGIVMDPADVNGIDDDGNGFVDDLIGWDFDNNDREPNDDNSHGSHTAGTVAGDGTAGTQSGMAPDAKVMIVKVGVTFADEVDVWNGMQYAAANGAHSISMSLGWPHNQNPDRATWRTNCGNVIDAGTAMVIAAGNEGSGAEPDNVRTPGDVPRVITVGAVDCNDNIAGFSSRGPVTWQSVPPFNDHPFPPGLIKPDVSGPGVDTKSHNVCSGYAFNSGTSMATPHVAGAVALMVSANPGATPDDIKQVLEETAIDLGPPGKDNEYGTGRVDAYEAVLNSASPNGRVNLKETISSCSATLNLSVTDSDLRGTLTLTVKVSSNTEPGGENIVLSESGSNSGSFKGTFTVAAGSANADGVVQVSSGDLVTATYVDANDGQGGLNVTKTDTLPVDCTPPVIGNVRTTDATLTSAIVRWSTNETSDSQVNYDPTVPPASQINNSTLVTDHAVSLTGLTSCTVYYYSVHSADQPRNGITDNNSGLYYHFETQGDFGQGPQSCHGGKVSIDNNFYACNSTLSFTVSDLDLNRNSGAIDTAVLRVTSSSETTPEFVTVTETAANSSRFAGSLPTTSSAAAPDGKISVKHGDTITVTYLDSDDGTGAPGLSFDIATADCGGPIISSLRVDSSVLTDQRATIRWTTSEPSDSVLEWGTTPALGNTLTVAGLVTDHSVLLNRFDTCNTLYFRVKSTDAYGNLAVGDNHGSALSFRANQIPGLYYRENFETGATTWTRQGEWQVDAPQAKGNIDPAFAYNNNKVLGHDLTGLGANPGNYEPNLSNQATRTPTFNASTWQHTKLLFYRKLSVELNDDASLWIFTPQGLPVYRSLTTTVADPDWTLQTFDLTSAADGKPAVYFEFRQKSNGSDQRGGWTVDDFILKDGSKPDYGPCGGCGSPPSFAGAGSAIDNNACAATGVTVNWSAAVSWGTGSNGTYSVYRSSTPGFVPSASNRIGAGVAGTSFNDAAAPSGTLYYIVRAENDETCGAGPNNGGAIETNTVQVSTDETATRPVPGEATALNVSLVGKAHVRLAWNAATNATRYNVYRSPNGAPGSFTLLGSAAGTSYEDLNQGSNANAFFYLVKGANLCNQEGP
ncbi:MAG: S8 family serine peptidase [Acidobacteriota bacterium]